MTGKDMTEKDKVLSANLDFYRAFTTRDAGAMDRQGPHHGAQKSTTRGKSLAAT